GELPVALILNRNETHVTGTNSRTIAGRAACGAGRRRRARAERFIPQFTARYCKDVRGARAIGCAADTPAGLVNEASRGIPKRVCAENAGAERTPLRAGRAT